MVGLTQAVAARIAGAGKTPLDDDKADAAKKRILDTLIAMISGSALPAGQLARRYAAMQRTHGDATIVGTDETANTHIAAFCGAMAAHADETDDVSNLARLHPGACVVPAAVSFAETVRASGEALIRAVALGYDVAGSVNMTAWTSLPAMQKSARAPHGLGGTFGAMAASASLAGLDERECVYALSYAGQQSSGLTTFYRDREHVGKAFATAAMQASNGVRCAELVQAGFTDISDMLDGTPNVFDGFGNRQEPEHLLTELAQANHVATTDQKRYPVGMPIQAAAEAMELILGRHRPTPDQIVDIECRLPSHGARIVGDRTIPDINLQYVLAVQVLDGRLTFESAHDYERISDPATQRLMERINLVADDSLEPPDVASPETRRTRIADLRIRLTDGTELRERVDGPLGTRFRPFGWNHLAEKAHMVLDGSHGSDFADELVAIVQTLGSRSVIADLQPLLRVPAM